MTDFSPTSTDRDILSVSQLNRHARQLLETHLPLLWVEGEISNLAQPSSGHWYFTLKDDQAQVRCAMFRNRNSLVRFRPGHGQQVLVRARVSLYEGRGDYQLIVEHMEEAGFGALQRAFEALKQKLAAEGLFAAEHKRPLPRVPQHIGVITSPTGAAIRDVLTVLGRRFPGIPVTVIPVAVQGKEAALQIAEALALANQLELFDVLLLTRGGGSLEDLWSFNEEIVARAIYASRLPVVCAVGHEVDITIADFVADLRAPTPSAAAELLTPDASDWLSTFQLHEARLERGMQRQLQQAALRLEHLHRRLRHPGERLQQQSQHLDTLELRLTRAMNQRLLQARTRVETLILRQKPQHPQQRLQQRYDVVRQLASRLDRQMKLYLQHQRTRLSETARLLNTVSPLSTLERGYSITRDSQGKIIKQARQLQPGDKITTRLAEGELLCQVEKIQTP